MLIFIIQWIFLGDLRSAIIVGANIPFALFFSIIILVLRGEEANLLSVGAARFRHHCRCSRYPRREYFPEFSSEPPDEKRSLLQQLAEGTWGRDPTRLSDFSDAPGWTDRLRLILVSALQVDKAMFFSTVIIVAAFVPLFTMQGVEGPDFRPDGADLCLRAGRRVDCDLYRHAVSGIALARPITSARRRPSSCARLRSIYTPVLRWSLRNIAGSPSRSALPFLVVSGFLGSRLGSEFLPTLEEGNLWIRASMPPTISLEAGMPIVNEMREILLRHPEVITVVSQHGRPDDGSDAAGFYNAEFFVPLKPFDEWPVGLTKDKLINELQDEFNKKFVGIDFNFSQYIQDNVEEGLSGVKGANSVKIIGPDLATLEKLARAAMAQMAQVQGITDLGVFWVLGQPNLNIRVDRTKAARYGLNVNDVNSVVQAALGGTTATTLLESDRQFDVVVRLAPKYRKDIEDVRNLKIGVQTPSGNAYIPLSELASISLDTGASYIFRERNQRFVPIKFSVRGRDLAGAVEEAQQRIAANVKLPVGYRLEWSGEFEWLQQAKQRLAVILPITLVFIMILLYTLFNSLRDTFLALLGLPFAISGGILALYVTGLDFSVSAAIGFISLLGVSVMSGILIISSYYRVIATGGMAPIEAMFMAVDPTDAAGVDDDPVGLYRAVSGGDFHRDRQPGATAARYRHRRRHADRTDHVAGGGAGVADAVPEGRAPVRGRKRV